MSGNPSKSKKSPVWEVEIKVRRGGKLVAHTRDRTFAAESALRAADAELAILRRTLDVNTP